MFSFVYVRVHVRLSFGTRDDLKNIKRINVKVCRANGHFPRTT